MLSGYNDFEIGMKKEMILERLREKGCRITGQRKLLLDIILSGECSSSKEIYYKASARDKKIGTATVYRMVNLLEEIGAIRRENMYKVTVFPRKEESRYGASIGIELDDGTVIELTEEKWRHAVEQGLRKEGYIKRQSIRRIIKKKENRTDILF